MKYFNVICKTGATICLIVMLFSCKKETVYEGLKGELKGRVSLHDSYATITDYSGVVVTVDGSSPALQTTTNEKGEYAFEGLKTGIYDIVFTKDGFAKYKIVSYQFIGGNIPSILGPLTLTKLPDFKISNLKVDTGRYSPYYYYVNVSGSLSVSTSAYLRYYVSDSPDVSYTNYQATDYAYSYSAGVLSFSPSNSILSKFSKGKQLYLVVYPYASSYATSYIDITTGNQIYPVNIGQASAVVPFMIPNTLSYY